MMILGFAGVVRYSVPRAFSSTEQWHHDRRVWRMIEPARVQNKCKNFVTQDHQTPKYAKKDYFVSTS